MTEADWSGITSRIWTVNVLTPVNNAADVLAMGGSNGNTARPHSGWRAVPWEQVSAAITAHSGPPIGGDAAAAIASTRHENRHPRTSQARAPAASRRQASDTVDLLTPPASPTERDGGDANMEEAQTHTLLQGLKGDKKARLNRPEPALKPQQEADTSKGPKKARLDGPQPTSAKPPEDPSGTRAAHPPNAPRPAKLRPPPQNYGRPHLRSQARNARPKKANRSQGCRRSPNP